MHPGVETPCPDTSYERMDMAFPETCFLNNIKTIYKPISFAKMSYVSEWRRKSFLAGADRRMPACRRRDKRASECASAIDGPIHPRPSFPAGA
jgi:hypothetical protein